jgi:SnoaL-like polyketide cyclase
MSASLINKAVVTQFITELFGRFSGEHVSSLVTEDFRAHGPPTLLRATFRQPRVIVQDLLAQGDRVAARYLFQAEYVGEVDGVDVSGQRIELPGMMIARMRGERIAECWWEEDRLAMLAQVRAA